MNGRVVNIVMDNDFGAQKQGIQGQKEPVSVNKAAVTGRCQFDITVQLARFSLHQLHLVYECFEGDIALAIVLGEVALHNVSRFQNIDKALPPGIAFWDSPDIRKLLLPCNALSISQSTGIPRETVRRKIARLVKLGWMEQNAKGEVIITRSVCLKLAPYFNAGMINSLLSTSNTIREIQEKAPNQKASRSNRVDDRPPNY